MRVSFLHIVFVVCVIGCGKPVFHHFHVAEFEHLILREEFYSDSLFEDDRVFKLTLDVSQQFVGGEMIRHPDTTSTMSSFHYTYLILSKDGEVYMNTFSRSRDTTANKDFPKPFQHEDGCLPDSINLKVDPHPYAKHGFYRLIKASKIQWIEMDKSLYAGKDPSLFMEIEIEAKTRNPNKKLMYVMRSLLIEPENPTHPDTLHVLDYFVPRDQGPLRNDDSPFDGARIYNADEIFSFNLKFVEIPLTSKIDFGRTSN